MTGGLGSEVRLRRMPWGLLGMVGLVIAIESGLAHHDHAFTAVWQWDWRVIGHQASSARRVQGKDVLVFGDSLAKFGLMPRVIRETSGRSAYNLALHSGHASSSYILLRRALRAGARPTAVVLDATPHLLMKPPDDNQNLWADLLSVEECLELSRTMGDPSFLARTILQAALPSMKRRQEIRARLLGSLEGRPREKGTHIPSVLRNWEVNEGAQLMARHDPTKIDASEWIGTLYERWEPDPVNVAYLRRFLGFAADHGIVVYWLLPPLHPEIQAGIDANLFDLSYSYFVMEIQADFPGTVVVDSRHSGFGSDLFLDGAHLNRDGAVKLSAAVADLLHRPVGEIGPSGWARIDLGRAADYLGSLEDVGQSTLALHSGSGPARR